MSNILEHRFLAAVYDRDKNLVKKLLDNNPNLDVNYKSQYIYINECALELALRNYVFRSSQYDTLEIIKLLLNNNSIIIDDNIMCKVIQSLSRSSDIMNLFIEKVIKKLEDINKLYYDWTLLMHVIKYGQRYYSLAESLIKKGASVNTKSSNGVTSLMILLDNQDNTYNIPIFKLLLDAGAQVNTKIITGINTIDTIKYSCDTEIILLLTDKFNTNPLMKAIIKIDDNEILNLIKQEKYINDTDIRNETAIFYYVRYYFAYNLETFDALLESKTIDLTIRNCDNDNILSMLQKNERYKNDKLNNDNILFRKIATKLMNNETYYKDLKIIKLLELYFSKDLVDNIIYKYI